MSCQQLECDCHVSGHTNLHFHAVRIRQAETRRKAVESSCQLRSLLAHTAQNILESPECNKRLLPGCRTDVVSIGNFYCFFQQNSRFTPAPGSTLEHFHQFHHDHLIAFCANLTLSRLLGICLHLRCCGGIDIWAVC